MFLSQLYPWDFRSPVPNPPICMLPQAVYTFHWSHWLRETTPYVFVAVIPLGYSLTLPLLTDMYVATGCLYFLQEPWAQEDYSLCL